MVASFYGWCGLLLSYCGINASILLLHPSTNWGELGFVATSILIMSFLSVGHAAAVFIAFIPLESLKRRNKIVTCLWMETIIGGAVWGILVPIISVVVVQGVMGGTSSEFLNEIFGLVSAKGITWVISSTVAGAITFGWASHRRTKRTTWHSLRRNARGARRAGSLAAGLG
jgi:hypothetical protein